MNEEERIINCEKKKMEISCGEEDLNNRRNTPPAEKKAFRVPVVIRTEKDGKLMNIEMPQGVAQADQGSDMVVVSIGLLKAFNINPRPLAELGYNNLTMNVADGRATRLTQCCTLRVGVLGIWRTIEAFVRPYDEKDEKDIHMLLGLPWLHSVDAKMFIRASKIELGDIKRGEDVVELRGPQFTVSPSNKLILQPKTEDTSEEESEEESSSDDSESES